MYFDKHIGTVVWMADVRFDVYAIYFHLACGVGVHYLEKMSLDSGERSEVCAAFAP